MVARRGQARGQDLGGHPTVEKRGQRWSADKCQEGRWHSDRWSGRRRRITMTTRTTSRLQLASLAALLGLVIAAIPAEARQSGEGNGARPDFSGVWRTINPPAAPRVNTTLRWLPGPGELPDFTPAYKQ